MLQSVFARIAAPHQFVCLLRVFVGLDSVFINGITAFGFHTKHALSSLSGNKDTVELMRDSIEWFSWQDKVVADGFTHGSFLKTGSKWRITHSKWHRWKVHFSLSPPLFLSRVT